MRTLTIKPENVCSREMIIDIDDDGTIVSAKVIGGCMGNLQGICRLIEGQKVECVLKGVSILGPCRKLNQVELSATDARSIGIKAPIRESGDVAGSAPCKLVGPAGEVELSEGVIVAKRHIHMTPADAEEFGVKNGEIVKLEMNTPERSLTFGDVVVRVREDFALAAHIDTDESNAASAGGTVYGKLIK